MPRRFLLCSSWPFPNIMMPSEIFLHPGRPERNSLLASWKMSVALTPNGTLNGFRVLARADGIPKTDLMY